MKTHILRGSKQEIANSLAQIHGEVREAIVFEEELAPAEPTEPISPAEDIFAEMRSYMVDAQNVDDSREAIYAPVEGE
jgi:hypothetical protein